MASLGHVVFYVHELERSLTFYRDAVGLELVGRIFGGRGAILTGGETHHELLLIQVGDAPGPLTGHRAGLYHVGWKIGESMDALRAARERVMANGYRVDAMADHTVSQSLYLRDPDGNEVELYVDDPSFDWKTSRSWLEAPVKALEL
jgi:catechol 2,3-dioxygenase